jgi:tetratricopeptide (TPR) repeat protein
VGGVLLAQRFELEVEVGRGGMGSVHRGFDHETGETVAIKLLTDDTHADRFLREAEVLAGLGAPEIVRWIAHGKAGDGRLYIAMEWLDGEDLGERLAKRRMSRHEALAVVRRAAAALAFAHTRGIVHRDVKPSNIFLPNGDAARAKLLDFGIALGRSAQPLTLAGQLVGTPGYMAPEQARGERDVDARADVFALGCVLYKCVTGVTAFDGEAWLGILAKVLHDEPPRLRDMRADVPEALDDLVARMLSKDRARRPASVEVLAELTNLELGPAESQRLPLARPSLSASERRFIAVLLLRPPAPTDTGDIVTTRDTWLLENVRQVVGRFGGTATRLLDGTVVVVLARSGATAVDRAEEAARCALEVRRLLPDAALVLATGHSEVVGERPLGRTIDRAAGLLLGRRGDARIVVDEPTVPMLEGRFLVRHADGIELHAERDAVELRSTLLGKATPFVGREGEVTLLKTWFTECDERCTARAVIVTAPAGAGKSRLAQEFFRDLREAHPTLAVWSVRADPTRAASTFGVLGPLVRRVAGIHDGEPVAERQRKLKSRLAVSLSGEDLAHAVTFVGELAGVPPQEATADILASRRDAKLLGEQMRRAFCVWLRAECHQRPLALVFEDLHWGDLPSVKFVERALRELRDQRLFVVALARPEIEEVFPHLWSSAGALRLPLAALNRRASETLASHFLAPAEAATTIPRIVEQAAGNAFFLEELIRSCLEDDGVALPETVLAMATTRIERFAPEARRVLRAASVFGESFWERGVIAVVDPGGAEPVSQCLADLVASEIIMRRRDARFAGEMEFVFRHGLMREAAYGMLTDEDRRLGHRLAAEWLEAAGETEASVLAEHAERGGDEVQARQHHARAAVHALEANDFRRALSHATRTIELGADGATLRAAYETRGAAAMGLGDWAHAPAELRAALAVLPKPTDAHEVELHLKLSRASFFAYDVPALRQHVAAAAARVDDLGRPDLRGEVSAAQGLCEQVEGNLKAAAAQYAVARAEARGAYVATEAQLLMTPFWLGHFGEAVERGRAFVERAQSERDVYAWMVALPQIGLALAAMGRYAEAQAVFDEAREVGTRYDTLPLVARALAMSVGYRQDIFDFAGADAIATEALELALSVNYPATAVSMLVDRLVTAARIGDVARAERELPEATARVATTEGQGWHGWLFKMRLTAARAEIAVAKADWEAALAAASDVVAQSGRFGRAKYMAIGRSISGRASLALGRTDEGIVELRSALDLATRMEAPALVLRAAEPLLEVVGDDSLRDTATRAVTTMADGLPPGARAELLRATRWAGASTR